MGDKPLLFNSTRTSALHVAADCAVAGTRLRSVERNVFRKINLGPRTPCLSPATFINSTTSTDARKTLRIPLFPVDRFEAGVIHETLRATHGSSGTRPDLDQPAHRQSGGEE